MNKGSICIGRQFRRFRRGCLLCSREQQIGTLDWDRRRERRPGAADRNSVLGQQTGEAAGSSR
ncbi:hypothetical protein MCJ35_02200 [Enterocloster sp. OA13]|uniref:hypothetical protein n=1 Tax=Enterocloster TaxID=2719313 RepID=UPI0004701A9C|nr:hypothetical protein [Lachnoclostridium pacaense]MCC2818882.1 hypothetical protein [Lachnoclostridium pacaense]MCC2876387.1 hypothetical protein [Lachnoclostridium pacaense]MCH1948013.1 hypothetical protein [Enterocloster sp. OA13]